MITKVTCSECGASLGITGVVQAVIECPKCGAEIHTITVDDDEVAEEQKPKRKKSREDEDDKPRGKSAKNVRADENNDAKPRKKSKSAAEDEPDEDDGGKKKGKKKKKDERAKKMFAIRLAALIGVGAIAILIAVLIINGRKKDDNTPTAKNENEDETQQPINPNPVPSTGAPKKDPSKKEPEKKKTENPPKKETENPPKKEPENPPKKEPPKKEPPKKEELPPLEDPLALIRTLESNIDIPKLPPPDKRPVLVLNSTGHSGQMVDAFFTPDAKRIVSVSKDKTIRIWDLALGETVKTIHMPNGPGEEGDLEAAALSPDGKRLAVGGKTFGRKEDNALVYVILLDKGTIERTFKGHRGSILCLTFSANGQWIASGSNDAAFFMYNIVTGAILGPVRGHQGIIRDITYHPKEARIATASSDGTARIWMSGQQGYPHKECAHPKEVRVNAVAWSPDGTKLATGGEDGIVRIWSKEGAPQKTFAKLEEVEDGQKRGGAIYSLCFTKDGKEVIYTGVGAAQTGMFNIDTGQHRKVPLHTNTVSSSSVSKDGTLAVTAGGSDNEILIWKTADGSKVKRLAGEGRAIWGLAFSKDSRTLLWGGNNRGQGFPPMRPVDTAFRLDLMDFSTVPPPKEQVGPIGEFKGLHIVPISRSSIGVELGGQLGYVFGDKEKGEAVYSASFLNLGQMVVGSAGNLTLVDVPNRRILGHFEGHNGQQLSIAVPPNRDWFATGSIDQTIRFYRTDRFDPFLSIFFAGRDWIAWTPEGYYSASPNGERLMGWLVDSGEYKLGKFFTAAQFRQSLYQPQIIRNLFRVNGDLKYAMALYVKETNQLLEPIMLTQVIPPEVQITSPTSASESGDLTINEETIEVEASAKSVGNKPVTSMRLIVDGRPYGGAGGLFIIPKDQQKLGEVKRKWRVTLPRGTHSLVVTAQSAVSRGVSPTLEIEQTFGDDKLPNLYMLVVGINEYGGGNNLNYAASDANTIARVLQEKTKEVFGKVELKLLLDKNATRANVLEGLEWLEKTMTPRDVALFYFSGHGTRDPKGNFYLCTVDQGKDPDKRWLSGEIMKQKLTNMPGRVIAMLDACHSGAAKFSIGAADNLVRDLQNDDCGVIVIAASLGEEVSLESQTAKGGFFTLALTEALTGTGGADFNSDGVIQLNEMLDYTVRRVRELSRDEQHPAASSSAKIKPFALTKP